MTVRAKETSPRRARVPLWASRATDALLRAAAAARVIASTTPSNLRAELERLASAWAASGGEAPRFSYGKGADHRPLRAALEALAGVLEGQGDLGRVYAARARELEGEAALCEAAGGPSFWAAARRRYARRDRFDAEADALAEAWLGEPPEGDDPGPLVRSDDEGDAGSLVSRMREELGKRRLPTRVVVEPNIASLAATGDGFVQVVQNRMLTARDVERTVLHEVEGHVAPRVAASSLPLGIFRVGTARGADDQEGRALALERAAGLLDGRRRREIALRHAAARSVEAGADFVSTARLLLDRHAPLADALRIAARTHRGGGLGREAVYLPALLRVEAALAHDPSLDEVLARGRVAVDAAPVLRPWLA